MISVCIEALKPDGTVCGGNGWHNTDNIIEAILLEKDRFEVMYDVMQYGQPQGYRITIGMEQADDEHRNRHGRPLVQSADFD